MNGTNLTPDIVEEMLSMASSGNFTMDEVAGEFHVHPTTVRRLCRVNGVKIPRITKAMRMSKETKDDIMARFMAGEKILSIISRYRITYTVFYSVLAEYPEAQATRSSTTSDAVNARDEMACKLYEQGSPLWKIKSETGISQMRLHEQLHVRGIPLRTDIRRKWKEHGRNQPSLWDPNNPMAARDGIPGDPPTTPKESG